MVVEKYVPVKMEIEITGATLLSTGEAFLNTKKERAYDRGWWLRSPGRHSHCACYVHSDGYFSAHGGADDADVSVRPALILKNIEETDFQIGDVFAVRGYRFKIISNTRAWMYESDIGRMVFRQDWKASDANVYEKSDVKKFVDKWFEELIK